MPEGKQSFLEGAESLDIYMKHHGYGSITGLAYPFDSMFMKSPRSVSLLAEHYRGDDEKFAFSEKENREKNEEREYKNKYWKKI